MYTLKNGKHYKSRFPSRELFKILQCQLGILENSKKMDSKRDKNKCKLI